MRLVYNSFAGRYSDSPRAVYERLRELGDEHEHTWLADPAHLSGFPADARTVVLDSAEGVAALESADAVVANTHTEVEWTKAPGALYLQTWHGTPLKRIHHDVLPTSAPGDRLQRLDRDVARWDVLLSPNRVSTERLRRAFRFDGRVVETGYPRNDLLLSPERDAVRAKVRADLGIADHTTAVLYTPTWRDDDYYAQGRPDIRLALDVERFVERMGEDWVLLPRLHYMMTDRMQPLVGPGVRDVSWHPDVRELYLAADAMVTDYSSTMFDFAVTGKPLLFFAYDLATYRDSVRGLYFDPIPEAPGPVAQTLPQLLDALSDLDGVRREHAGRYAAFQERYCHLEDGRATDRVLDLLLEGR
ncbi:CDP-glycerol glycerophosphotransferase family protein [Quadrisphaera sp. DSM 44207]|uniref:CDP-glycerol glycerophosphotransferase family protein n=1 Tax=Quadrisphaera sp. DSM 44207 TaxID=1881057 RepID=UPI000889F1FD|nr:CDP-glycerol glycerophosphotransferase family protein [Quadrisphaera sp. DSM 44207]SDQ04142.1 CDP-glycerol glycerophosphotransferase [Quadrisphaera sp. DSM 44207]